MTNTTNETTQAEYIVLVRDTTNGGWSAQIGENAPRSYDECADDIDGLVAMSYDGWSDDENDYLIEEIDDQGNVKSRSIQVWG